MGFSLITMLTLQLVVRWLYIVESTIILRYSDDIEHFYMRLKSDFNEEDPFKTYDRLQRHYLCDLIFTSNSYVSQDDDSFFQTRDKLLSLDLTLNNYQTLGYNNGYPEEVQNALMYNVKSLTITDYPLIDVEMFPCALNNKVETYLTYGFKINYMFMIVKNLTGSRHHPRLLKIWNLIESNPIFFEISSNMNDIFWDNLERVRLSGSDTGSHPILESSSYMVKTLNILIVPRTMEIHNLSGHQHFRLCASIADELRRYPEFQLNIGRRNIIYPIMTTYNLGKVIMKDDRRFIAHANVLPCAVNRQWIFPQFYVLRDQIHPLAVYVFRPSQDRIYGEILMLEGKMIQVMALRDA